MFPRENLVAELDRRGVDYEFVHIKEVPARGKIKADITFFYTKDCYSNIKRIEKHLPPVFSRGIDHIVSKEYQYRALKMKRVPVPPQMMSSSRINERFFSQNIGLPCIVKPVIGSQGRGVKKVHSKKELHLLGKKTRLIIQKYIPEAVNGDVRAFVADGRVAVALKRIPAEGCVTSNFHTGATPEKYFISDEEAAVCIAATEACGLNVAGVDFVPSENGPIILEVNVTPGLRHLHEYGGVDPVAVYVDAIIREAERLDANPTV